MDSVSCEEGASEEAESKDEKSYDERDCGRRIGNRKHVAHVCATRDRAFVSNSCPIGKLPDLPDRTHGPLPHGFRSILEGKSAQLSLNSQLVSLYYS